MAKTPRGLYRDDDGYAYVDYDSVEMPIPANTYRERGYQPDYDALPTKKQYDSAEPAKQEEAKKATDAKGS